MTFGLSRDLAATIAVLPALQNVAATAGGSGDNTDANGVSIDQAASGRQKAECITFIVQGTAVLGAAATLTNAIRVQDSANGSSWADVTDPRTGTVFGDSKVSAAGAGTNSVVAMVSVPTEYLRQYVRVVAKPDLSAANTDTATLQGVAILSGLAKI